METTSEIIIRAPAGAVFALAADTERWPRILPHYRSVRRLRGDGRRALVAMRAWRTLYPVSWVAVQENFPAEQRITFRHVRGISRGMDVEWRLTETADGTRVRIWHAFHSGLPLVGEFFARRIVGQLFVSHIAGKTLRRIKQLAESPRDLTPRPPSLRGKGAYSVDPLTHRLPLPSQGRGSGG